MSNDHHCIHNSINNNSNPNNNIFRCRPKGDATLIEGKHGEVILIDTGPKYYVRKGQPYYNIANNVLIPVLNYKGIEAIDLLIITHFDQDHYGALADLADKIKIKKIIDNGNGNTHLKFQNTIKKH